MFLDFCENKLYFVETGFVFVYDLKERTGKRLDRGIFLGEKEPEIEGFVIFNKIFYLVVISEGVSL